MSSVLKSIKYYLKSFIFGSLITGCALYGVIAAIILRILGKEGYTQYTVARAFYYSFSTILGVKIIIKNEKYLQNKPGIFISNHQSALDILVLGKVFQPGFTVTAKSVLKYVPFLGWFMLASGTFFLDRTKGEKARKVLEKGLASLREKNNALFIFPEGTRSASKKLELLPFKKGAFHLAKQGEIPIIPIVVSNTSNIFNARDKIFNGGEIVIEVLEPMPTDGLKTNEDVTEFSINVRNKMLETLEKIGYSRVSGSQSEAEVDCSNEEESDINTDTDAEVVSEETPLVSKD